jgi:hypothetical protein
VLTVGSQPVTKKKRVRAISLPPQAELLAARFGTPELLDDRAADGGGGSLAKDIPALRLAAGVAGSHMMRKKLVNRIKQKPELLVNLKEANALDLALYEVRFL